MTEAGPVTPRRARPAKVEGQTGEIPPEGRPEPSATLPPNERAVVDHRSPWAGLFPEHGRVRTPITPPSTSRSTAEMFRQQGERAAQEAWEKSALGPRAQGEGPSAVPPASPPAPPSTGLPPSPGGSPARRRRASRSGEERPEPGTAGARARAAGPAAGPPAEHEHRYRQLLVEVVRERSTLAEGQAALDRVRHSLVEREAAIREREQKVRAAEEELERQGRSIALREREVHVREAGAGRHAPAAALDAHHGASPLTLRADWRDPSLLPPPAAGSPPSSSASSLSPAGDVGNAPRFLEPRNHRHHDRLPTGTSRLDDLLLGGLPPRSHVVLLGDAFVGKEVALYAFIAEGLRRLEPVIVVTASRTSQEVARALRIVLPEFESHEKKGLVTWIDASGAGAAEPPNRFAPRDSDDTAGLLAALVQAARASTANSPTGRFRLGFLGLAAVLAHNTERDNFQFLQNVLGILKPREAVAMYALEAGALAEPQVESFLGRMDGAVLFRQDRGRTFVSVKGFGEVATRDWIECRATDRALILGSFALERIR